MKSYYSIQAQRVVTLKVAGLFCQAKYLMVSSNNIVLKIDWSNNRTWLLTSYTFEYYSRVNSITVKFPFDSCYHDSCYQMKVHHTLYNQTSKNQFQELKSCLFGFHHGQITEENHVLFLSTKTATEASSVETPSQFDIRLSDQLRRSKVHSIAFLRDLRLYDKKVHLIEIIMKQTTSKVKLYSLTSRDSLIYKDIILDKKSSLRKPLWYIIET